MASFQKDSEAQSALYIRDPSYRGSKSNNFQTFSGSDIKAVMYLPLLTKGSIQKADTVKFKVFADLQTISISSTRSVSPIRVFGKSSPIAYTRGARTIAGSLVFATIRKDPFNDVADASIAESYINASTSLIADQLPPFSIIITASNELGAVALQAVHGVTITNYGTTYSVDDLYTETTYTYVATDVVPLIEGDTSRNINPSLNGQRQIFSSFNSISNLVAESLGKAYGQISDIVRSINSADNQRSPNILGT